MSLQDVLSLVTVLTVSSCNYHAVHGNRMAYRTLYRGHSSVEMFDTGRAADGQVFALTASVCPVDLVSMGELLTNKLHMCFPV